MTAPIDFLIAASATGSDPNNWSVVSTLLSTGSGDVTSARALQFDYEPFSKYVTLANGHKKGLGYPVAHWVFKALRPAQRENLRDFCTGVSADVYIRTRLTETTAGAETWGDFSAIMKWKEGAELIGVNYVEVIEITFTHLEAV